MHKRKNKKIDSSMGDRKIEREGCIEDGAGQRELDREGNT